MPMTHAERWRRDHTSPDGFYFPEDSEVERRLIDSRTYFRPCDKTWWADLGGDELAGPYPSAAAAGAEILPLLAVLS